jgi:hypothetical protein
MTGTSIVRFGSRPNRASMIANLSQSMNATWSIALYEHLDANDSNPSATMAGPETISFSPSAWKLWESEFPHLLDEFSTKFDEFRFKWNQRFSTDEIHRQLLQSEWLIQEDQGWRFSSKLTKQEVKNLYFSTIHLMVGDAEKLLVMMSSRASHLQERLSSYWYKEGATDALSKVLPCLEASLRQQETDLVTSLRASLAEVALKRFFAGFSTSAKPRYYPTSMSCARNVGRLWDLNGAYENPFLAYTDDFCDYAAGLTLLIGRWYQEKWSLFLRGFSRGQLDLFGQNSQSFNTNP